MITKFKTKLLDGYDIDSQPELYRKLLMTSALLIITVITFFIYIIINLYIGNPALIAIDAFVILITLYSIYNLFVKKKLEFSIMITVSMLFTFILFFIFINKNHSFGLVWSLAFPMYVIPILSKSKSIAIVCLFYLILLPMSYLGIGEWDNGYWNWVSFLRFVVATLAIIGVAYIFESSSMEAYKSIVLVREKEKHYLEKLKILSVTDQLTGLYNRRYFDEHFDLERKKVQRYNKLLSLIMIDIDHFKTINDKYGHALGDTILKEFSLILQSNIRNTDQLSRWGGEEFIILLPETNLKNATLIAEKIRFAIEKHVFTTVGNVTISAGVALIDGTLKSNNQAIQKVDTALFRAKSAGRNRVRVFEDKK